MWATKIILISMLCVVKSRDICEDTILNTDYKRITWDYCKNRTCIMQCCPNDSIIHVTKTSNKCREASAFRNLTSALDYSELSIYKKSSIKNVKEEMKVKFKDHFSVIFNTKMRRSECVVSERWTDNRKVHLLEDGSLITERPNYFDRWEPIVSYNKYCISYKIKENSDGTVEGPALVYIKIKENRLNAEQPNERSVAKDIYTAIGLLISCFFMLLVLFVHAVLPCKRKLAELVLASYVVSIFSAFFFIAVEIIALLSGNMPSKACDVFSVIIYFSLLSSAFWMNVMSFDIWWTCRGTFYNRTINRRGENVKFFQYCLYAWGVPLIITVLAKIIDSSDLSHMPGFVKPHFSSDSCFFIKMEKMLYLNLPMFILILCNWVFFMMTAYNIRRIKMAILKHEDSDTNKKESNNFRFLLYIKLSLVMGISWIFEAVSTLNPDSPIWYITDTYNMFIGVAIFFIFVFNRKTCTQLCKKFSIECPFGEKTHSTVVSNDSK